MDFKKDISDILIDAETLLKQLISYPTIYQENEENTPFGLANQQALSFLLKQAEKDGFSVFNDENYAGHIEFGSGDEILGILAHMDVVPVQKEEWSSDPFVLTFYPDRMVARGVVDDKGPLVACYMAMRILQKKGFVPKRKIRLIVGCDEESGSRCLKHYFQTQTTPALAFSPDADFPLIYGEKALAVFHFTGKLGEEELIEQFHSGTRHNIVPSVAMMTLKKDLSSEFLNFLNVHHYRGEVIDHRYYAYGVASHAMVPQKGVNAAFILFEFLEEVYPTPLSHFFHRYLTFDPFGKKLGIDTVDPVMKELTLNVGIVEIQNGEVFIGLDARVPKKDYEKILKDKCSKALSSIGFDLKISFFGGYHYVNPKEELVTTLMNVYRTVTQDSASEPLTIGGGTYAKLVENAVAFGPLLPGREDVCHIADEYLLRKDFKLLIEIYVNAIYELAK